MKQSKRTTSLILFSAILTGILAGCGSEPTGGGETSNGTTSAEVTTEAGYAYPDVNYDGYEFRILNIDNFYNCYVKTDVAEQTGETVDDAVYLRNRKVEDKLGIKISEIAETFTSWNDAAKPGTRLQQSVMSGDDDFDCAYVSMAQNAGIVTGGYVLDLKTVPGLNLDEEWWDTDLNSALELDGKLFCATSPLQLTSLDLTWVLLFNKQILENNKLEMPYDLVREGKWTMDKMYEYVSAIANLNGDDSFSFTESGKAVYGIAAHTATAPYLFLLAGDNKLVGNDKSGKLTFFGGTERLYNTVEKAAKLLNADDGSSILGDADFAAGAYYYMFSNERAAFLTTELKGTQVMRPYNVEFGILPTPKYDENQENYVTYASENVFRLCIPANAAKPERTGVILDALSYESKYEVLPLYYNQTICQKGLRDDDSIEMLSSYISDARMTEVGLIFGITTSLVNNLKTAIRNGDTNAASIIAAGKDKVETEITDLLEAIK